MASSAASDSRTPVERAVAGALSLRSVRAFLHYSEHRGPLLADSVTYRTLFSVFAGVLLGFSIAALWLRGSPEAWKALIDAVDAAVPGLLEVVDPEQITAPAGLTLAGVVSLVGLVGASIGAIGSLRTALRTLADRVHDDVLFVWVLLRNLALAVGIGVALAAAAAATFLLGAGVGLVAGWLGLAESHPVVVFGARAVGVVVVFLLDAVVVGVLFRVLSGVRARPRRLIVGALLGGLGLIVLQQLSSLFVGGAASNPLLATFASLIALLLWFNLSAQVILLASAYIIVSVAEDEDRVRARHGAATFAARRVQNAENAVQVATEELARARDQVAQERATKDAQRA